MKRFFTNTLACTILLSAVLVSCEKKEAPLKGKGPKNTVDIKHQLIDLTFNWELQQACGFTEITLVNLSGSDTLYLDATILAIENVALVNGTDLQFAYEDEKVLKVSLDQTDASQEAVTLKIAYCTQWVNQSDPQNIWGSFGKGIRFFEPSATEKERRKQLWAVSEPSLGSYWFPGSNAPNDLRTTELKARVEQPLMALGNGTLQRKTDHEDGTTTFHWKTEIAHPPHLTSLVVGEYKVYEQAYKQVQLHNYGYPDEYIGTKESVVRLPDMMRFFSEITGQTYPFGRYSQIFVQDFGGWKPGLGSSLITENMIDDKTTHEDFLYGWDLTEGEALAYQWFGAYLQPVGWNDVWLSKGFSRYFAGLYNQYKNGNTEFLTYQLSPDLSTYLGDWKAGLETIVVPESIENMEAFVNGNAPYAKGARVLHMLRKELGEAQWSKLIQNYVSRYGGKLVTTADFVELVNEIHGEPMDWFFGQWVYGVGHPIFKVRQNYDGEKKELRLSIVQTQQVDSIVQGKKIPFFKGHMAIEIDGVLKAVKLEAKKEQTFTFAADALPEVVNFDFEDAWIKEASFEKSLEERLREVQKSTDALHRLEMIRALGPIATDTATGQQQVSEIAASLRKSALDEPYWRMRLMAISQLTQLLSAKGGKDGIPLDADTEAVVLSLVEKEQSWLKAWVINLLGLTRSKKYVPLYLDGLKDYSDRVVFMSAIALGKSGDPRAFEALTHLPNKPSWKNQSLISALYGLKELEDERAYELAINSLTDSDNPHWNLGTPIWDHRLAATHTLVAIGMAEKGYPLVFEQFTDAMAQGHINDIFYNTQLVSILGVKEGKIVFETLRQKFGKEPATLAAIKTLEDRFNAAQ